METTLRTFSVLVDDEPGVLSQISRLFSRKGFNIESLALVVMMIFRPKGLLGSYDFSLSRSLETFLNRLIGRTENPKKEAADNE